MPGSGTTRCQHRRLWSEGCPAACRESRTFALDPITPQPIVTLPDLLEELDHIRRKGGAIENGEYKIGLRSVSAPVFDREGQMRYTLTVVGLFRHVASGEFEEAVDMVCAAAGSLSRELGYHA